MKSLLSFAFVVSTTALCAAADTSVLKADQSAESEQQLTRVEREWNDAFKAQDKPYLIRLCSEDFLFTDDEGNVNKRAKYVEDAAQHIKVSSYTLSDMAVRTYGDTGIVNGRWTGTFAVDGNDASGSYRFTDTFVRRDRQWRAVASQMSHIPTGRP